MCLHVCVRERRRVSERVNVWVYLCVCESKYEGVSEREYYYEKPAS